MPVVERQFQAMGGYARVLVVGGARGLADDALARVHELEGRWSRFRSESEVSAINRAGGFPVAVSLDTYLLVSRAIAAWRHTDGRFDPTVLSALADLGYRRSFAKGAGASAAAGARLPAP